MPYHLAMPPLVEQLAAANPDEVAALAHKLYREPHSCAKCGGLFLATKVGVYELADGRFIGLCVRCAAHALCSGDAPADGENRETWERCAWHALAPCGEVPTEDDAMMSGWLLSMVAEQEGLRGLAGWVDAALERVKGVKP